jgi:hypothetical protein
MTPQLKEMNFIWSTLPTGLAPYQPVEKVAWRLFKKFQMQGRQNPEE